MSTELITQNGQSSIVTIEKIQSYLEAMSMTANLSKSEVKQFIEIASAYGLNPFKREIYASKYGNNFSIIVGFETYLKRAERSGKLAGWSVTTEGKINWQNIMDSDMVATITIYRKDWTHPFIHTVHFIEYVQRRSDGQVNKFWREKAVTMIKKVAMAQGFRLCFSDENGGLPYTSEEIANEQTMDAYIIESNMLVEETPEAKAEKRKYTKKDKAPELDYAKLKAKIHTAMTLDDLKKVWDECPECKTDKEIVNLVKERKAHIQDMMAAPVAPSIEEKIKSSKTEEEVWTLIENVTDTAILKIAKIKIEELTTTTAKNDLF